MWLRLATRGNEFRYVDEALVRYRLSPLGASRHPAYQALTRESMARSLLDHTGVSPETDAVISRETWALARQALAIDALPRPAAVARCVPLRPECEAATPGFRCRVARRAVVVAVSLPGTSPFRDERLPTLDRDHHAAALTVDRHPRGGVGAPPLDSRGVAGGRRRVPTAISRWRSTARRAPMPRSTATHPLVAPRLLGSGDDSPDRGRSAAVLGASARSTPRRPARRTCRAHARSA